MQASIAEVRIKNSKLNSKNVEGKEYIKKEQKLMKL